MDCTQAERRMHAWLDGELPPDKARGMTAHVRGCASCSARMEELSSLYDALEALPGLKPDAELVRDTLRAAAEFESPVRWWTGLPVVYKGAGVAAMAMGLLLGIFLHNASLQAVDSSLAATASDSSTVLMAGSPLEYL